jgi:hypothetical protein
MSNDIIKLAREAGFVVNEKARQHQPNCIFHTQYMVDELLKRFAELVRADEREALKRMVFDDAWALTFQTFGQYRTALAAAIRARGEQA